MARPRKRHVQQEIRFGDKRGGKRRGAGRPAKGPRPSERHETRPAVRRHEPMHVIIRVTRAVGSLRTRAVYQALRKALVTTLTRDNFRIVHFSIQGTHVHLLVEAHDRMALARGMQAFQISAAKHINAAISANKPERRRGGVFVDRYHVRRITSPSQARNALAYVLNNWRKHREHAYSWAKAWKVDLFSSGPTFDGWRDVDVRALEYPASWQPMPVWEPKTWLLREGWRRHGLIGSTEVPSEKKKSVAPVVAE